MARLVRDGFLFFANETGIIVNLWNYERFAFPALVILGALSCLLGVRVYRWYSAAMIFMLTATVACLLLRGDTSWRAIVTCFSVIGITLGFLALFWNKLDGCVLCALIGGGAGWLLFRSVWGVIPLALLEFVLMLIFPLETLRVTMAVFGSWVLWDLSMWQGMGLSWPLMIPAAAFGYLIQRLFSRNQTLFKKVRPDRMTHWMEERERKKKEKKEQRREKRHADSVPQGN